jgi:LysM repeat protein
MGFARIIILLAVALGLSGCVNKENYNREVLRATNFQRLLSEEEKHTAELTAEIAKLKDQVASLETKTKALTAQLNDAKAQVVRSLEEVGRLQDDLSEARATAGALNAVRSGVPKGPAVKPKGQTGVTPAPPVSSIEPPDRLGELKQEFVDKTKGKISTEPPDRLGELGGGTVGPKKGKIVAPAPVAPPVLSTEPPDRLGELGGGAVGRKNGKTTAPAPVKAPAVEDPSFLYHNVQKDETLKSIAKRYKTDVNALRELNDLAANEEVKAGDRIIVGQKP